MDQSNYGIGQRVNVLVQYKHRVHSFGHWQLLILINNNNKFLDTVNTQKLKMILKIQASTVNLF